MFISKKIIVAFLLISGFLAAQKDSILEKKYYKNGKVKLLIIGHGIDTVEFRKYFKNGLLGDSVWIVSSGKKQNAIGVEKSYYDNGKLASITFHGKDEDEYITTTYGENGSISSHVVKPTGVSYYYDKKGLVIKQFDENKFDDNVYVRKYYRKQKHLIGTTYLTRIKTKDALLFDEKLKVNFISGSLISLTLNSDTTPLHHCYIEGFSADSIYLSKFEYNKLYDRITDFNILKYDSTFAIAQSQLKTISYSKHYTKKRRFGAFCADIIGAELEIFPVLFGILLYKDFNMLWPYYGASLAVGVIIDRYSSYLYRSMVPKNYDMQKWKIKLRS